MSNIVFYILSALIFGVLADSNADNEKRVEAICNGEELTDDLALLCNEIELQKEESIKAERELVYSKCEGIIDDDIKELCIQVEIAKGTLVLNVTEMEYDYNITDVPPALALNDSWITIEPIDKESGKGVIHVAKGKGKGKGKGQEKGKGKGLIDKEALLTGLNNTIESFTEQIKSSALVTDLTEMGEDALNVLKNIDKKDLTAKFTDFLSSNGLIVAHSDTADIKPTQVQSFIDNIESTKLVDYIGHPNVQGVINTGVKMIEIWRANKFAMSDVKSAKPLQKLVQDLTTFGNKTRNEITELKLKYDPLGTSAESNSTNGPIQLGKVKLPTLNKKMDREIKNQSIIQTLQDVWSSVIAG